MTLILDGWLAVAPLACFAGAGIALAARRIDPWAVLKAATAAALAAASAALLAEVLGAEATRASGAGAAALVGALIAFLAWAIGRYSIRYLNGEPGQRRYVAAFLATAGSSGLVVASENLALLIVAWATGSFALDHLLTFYRDRPSAILVAHKKFVVARLAEICLITAAVLLYHAWGSLAIGDIVDAARSGPLPTGARIAAVMIAVAVALKSAQLPLHGWLIQVMEAPTPVSALLHAGVVNLGGFVLVRLGALIAASEPAQAMLVLFGSVTACIAGLVMLTRVTIKVRLAWSTCSQMGFMLMECGLGLYDLALLHLVAHGLYKAHAFLVSGETVIDSRQRWIIEQGASRRDTAWTRVFVALALTAGVVAGSALAWRRALSGDAVPVVALALVVFGLAPLLWNAGALARLRGLASVAILAQLYFVWHGVMGHVFGVVPVAASPVLAACAMLALATLYLAQWLVWARPDHALIQRAYPRMYAGLHLDERFHRLVARVWPARTAVTAMPAGGADPWTALEPK